MNPFNKQSPMLRMHRRVLTRGFTLIELMVGMLLGAATVVLIAQVVVTTEDQRRSTATGSDAQVNAALALHDISRSIKSAGYGMTMRRDAFGCQMRARLNNTDDYPRAGSLFPTRFEPLQLVNGGGTASDRLITYASDKGSFSAPLLVQQAFDGTTNSILVNTNLGADKGDMMLVVPPMGTSGIPCSVVQISNDAVPGNQQILRDSTSTEPWNQSIGSAIFPPGGYVATATGNLPHLVNLGGFDVRAVTVANEALVENRFVASNGTDSATETMYPFVMNFQAWYGWDSAGNDDQVDVYNTTQPTTGAQWSQVRVMRIAILTRDPRWNKEVVTSSAPVLRLPATPPVQDTVACGTEQCMTFDVSAVPDWQHYRYHVHTTIVPLRNLLWNTQ